jgi:hypothetical protein
MQGRDVSPLVRGEPVEWRKDFFCENLFANANQRYPRIEGVRADDAIYIRYFDRVKKGYAPPADDAKPIHEELFDLSADPRQMHNLVSNPACAERLERMRRRADQLRDEAESP